MKDTKNISKTIRKPDYGPTLSTNGPTKPRKATWRNVRGTQEKSR